MKNHGAGRVLSILGHIVVIAIVIFLLAPLVVVVGTAFSDTQYLAFPPDGLTFKWFGEVLSDPSWLEAIGNSALLALLSTVLASVLAFPAALTISRSHPRAAQLFTSVLTLPLMVPVIMFVLGLMLVYNHLDTEVPYAGLVVALTILVTPYLIRNLLAGMAQLNPFLEEAALNLGASRFRVAVQIILPNVRKPFLSGALLAAIMAFDELVVPLFLASVSTPTLPVRTYNAIAYDISPEIAAISTLTLIIIILVAPFTVRSAGSSSAGTK